LQLKWKYTQTDTSFHPSLSRIWPSAGLAERELWEMLGIAYSGNENLAPLLLDPQFEGFPLRRGFELRRPEGYAERLLRERHAAGLIRGVGPHGVRPGLPETGRTPSAPAPDTGGAP
jgi:NADH-quinone oxidoreductase subunit C